MRLIIRPRAEWDIAQGFAWYESRRAGLGAEFLEEVTSVLESIQLESLRFPLTLGPLRRALVHRFPYGIFFVRQQDAIDVIAVMHLARDPRQTSGKRS
jgi:plasmid stabilization system protein ParE